MLSHFKTEGLGKAWTINASLGCPPDQPLEVFPQDETGLALFGFWLRVMLPDDP